MNARRPDPSGLPWLLGAGALGILAAFLVLGMLSVQPKVEHAPDPVVALPTSTPKEPEANPVELPPITPRGDLSAAERTTIEIFRRAAPSVVFVTNLRVRNDKLSFDELTMPQGTGSGFVWDEEGHIVTNFHVIQGANAVQVTLDGQKTVPARVVGVAPDKDLAVLKLEDPSVAPRPLPIGSSSDLLVGQHVFAIGNPFGLDHTLSTGVISGLGREIMSVGNRPIQGVIQTDAAINPGNSGGPLLDSSGRLIGVNTAIYSPTGASAGIGFAVPVDTIRRIVPELIRYGRVTRAGLGVHLDEGALTRRLGIEGCLVLGVVQGSGAAEAGIRPTTRDPRTGALVLGDVIVGLEGNPVKNSLDLYRILDGLEVGSEVTITLLRRGKRLEVPVRLSALQD
ncbi:MAG: trypsin-like serine protease [Myxococcales bacterium]|nr:trypsin-like serine protease [Myxococcales bacterium]